MLAEFKKLSLKNKSLKQANDVLIKEKVEVLKKNEVLQKEVNEINKRNINLEKDKNDNLHKFNVLKQENENL